MRVKVKPLSVFVGLLALLAGISLAFAGGAAAVDYATDYSDDDSVHVSEQYDASDDLATVYADVQTITTIAEGDDTDTSTDVQFVVQGINESLDPASTELVNEQRTIEQDSLETFDFEPTDANNEEYESYYLHVESVTDGEHDRIDSVDSGTTVYSSGGGGLGGSDVAGVSVPILVGIVVVGYFVMRED